MNGRSITLRGALLACAALLTARDASAQLVVVSGNPGLLRVSAAIAGSEPIAVSNSSTTYTVITPNANRTYSITGRLNAAMPVGLALSASLVAPPGGTSLGPVDLDTTDRDLVTGIARRLTSTQGITYQLRATAAAGVVPNSSRTVTLTIVQAP
jgi:hypothetical protein